MPELKNSVERIKRELLHLTDLLSYYNQSQAGLWSADDSEFIRIWDLYRELRESLIKVDEEFFSKLRILDKPEPKIDSYHPDGFYIRKQFEPLMNEVALASSYLEQYSKIFEKPIIPFEKSLRILTSRFGKVVRQLRHRYSNRSTIEIVDEYDMQDLFHSLLYLFFDDVRAEEWTPSYAGGASRIDFLLKSERIAVELKKTRKSLDAVELGKQLIVDIAKYQAHPDVQLLVCFVYDPEFWITNPQGIENDLSEDSETFSVKVIIEPK